MKLRNLYLGVKDQLPLSRLCRNIRAGHVLGLFHRRSHFKPDGTPKVAYNRKDTAMRAAAQMGQKTGQYFSNYKCIYCDGYHLGKNRK